MLILKDREAIARIICPLAEYAQECSNCRTHSGCPDYWPDVADKVDEIFATLKELGYRKPGELLGDTEDEIVLLPGTYHLSKPVKFGYRKPGELLSNPFIKSDIRWAGYQRAKEDIARAQAQLDKGGE